MNIEVNLKSKLVSDCLGRNKNQQKRIVEKFFKEYNVLTNQDKFNVYDTIRYFINVSQEDLEITLK